MRELSQEDKEHNDLLDELFSILYGLPLRFLKDGTWERDLSSVSERDLARIYRIKGRVFRLRELIWPNYRSE